ncbi:MAG: hypothetical protein N4J56_001796 [Chroococcidiopsis sp. SAG 2025]|nr:hypothetical protein [Chroococcidiopsis sp. SAG 2025]
MDETLCSSRDIKIGDRVAQSKLSCPKAGSKCQITLKPVVLARSMETLEFVIYPDGRVQEKVTGIVGSSCTEVTAALEAELGQTISQQPTSEYFNQVNTQADVSIAQASFSEW